MLWKGGEGVSDNNSHMHKPTEKTTINTQRKTQLNFALATYENHNSGAAQAGLGMLMSKN